MFATGAQSEVAAAHNKILKFLERLQKSIESNKEKTKVDDVPNVDAKPSPKVEVEDVHPMVKLSRMLDQAFGAINEEVGARTEDAALLAERGQFVVDGKVVIGNHADILKILVMWMMDQRMEVLQSAIASIADSARNGSIFRT